MKNSVLLLACLAVVQLSLGQSSEYLLYTKKADSLYNAKDYNGSAVAYSLAFKANGWKGISTDRYNAACCWALSNNADSSFAQLIKIATLANYKDYDHIIADSDLNSLHGDPRWQSLLNTVKQNKEKAEVNLNKPVAAVLDSIYAEDQKYRLQLDDIEKRYGLNSKEMNAQWAIINKKDSSNTRVVRSILDKYGWLGEDAVGNRGASTLFLVIQHADRITQENYLPMIREAVKQGKASGSSLALLEDRVALKQGKRQIYGSQIGRDNDTKLYFVLPLEDPDNVDQRRASVGLPPLAEYVSRWKIVWDVAQYKRELPALEARRVFR